MIYIKFKILEKDKRKRNLFLERIITLFIPKANPKYDHLIDNVSEWILEFEDDHSIPSREIGVNENNKVIVKMPHNDNYGYWVDNNLVLKDFENLFDTHLSDKLYFEKRWKELE